MRVAALLGVLVLAGCGTHERASAPAARTPFDYDANSALNVRQKRIATGPGGSVQDISFASPRGGRVTGYLVVPRGGGRHPAVVLLHGAGGDRRELLPFAAGLAGRGVAALTLDSPASRAADKTLPPGMPGVRRRTALLEQEVVEARRAVDVLRAQASVDPQRLGFLGFSAGARSGAILSGVDHRIGSYVLVSGGASPVAEYLRGAPPELRTQIRPLLVDVDPLTWIKKARPGSIFFEDGRRDEIVPRAALVGLIRAAPKPQRVRWYPGGHTPDQRRLEDAADWLTQRLRPA
jgi:dienelactone hydrolase